VRRGFVAVPFLFSLFFILFTSPAFAVVETYEFGDDVERKRYQVFIEELRCPKCQNQNLSGSNSPIAADLRRELHRMIKEGQSDQAIVDFMVARYGDFVLYRPPLDKNTALLWAAPIILLLAGVLILVLFVRRQRVQQQAIALNPCALSEAEQQQLDKLLGKYKD
jgi:cytochrome c-type biogenesis protein CcmH